MPVFVPVLIGAAVAAATGKGAWEGKKGYDAMREAKGVAEDARLKYARHRESYDAARSQLNEQLEAYNVFRAGVSRRTFSRLFAFLEAIRQSGTLADIEDLQTFDVEPSVIREFVNQYIEAAPAAAGASTAVGAGVAATGLTTSLVASMATASTGTAIGSLGGAAAQSAMLAWLGGGSLAVGGGGMAVGTAVLGGVGVAPAVLVGGFVLAAQGEKALTRATAYASEVHVAVAKMVASIRMFSRVVVRIEEMRGVVVRLDRRVHRLLDRLEVRIESFDPQRTADVKDFQMVMILCKTLSTVLRTDILTSEGTLNRKTAELVKGGRR